MTPTDHDHSGDAAGADPSPVDDPVRDVIDEIQSTLPVTTPDALVAQVASRRADGPEPDGAPHHRLDRRVLFGAIGVAASLLMVAVGILATKGGGKGSQQVAVGARAHRDVPARSEQSAGVALGAVTVLPAEGLTDGQTVEVVVRGFDPGSEVTIQQCVLHSVVTDPDTGAVTSGRLCRFPTDPDARTVTVEDPEPVHETPSEWRSTTATAELTVHADLDQLKLFTMSEVLAHEGTGPAEATCPTNTGVTDRDATAGSDSRVSSDSDAATAPGAVPGADVAEGSTPAVDPDGTEPGVVEPGDGDAVSDPGVAVDPDTPVASTPADPGACVIVATGVIDGAPVTQDAVISFGDPAEPPVTAVPPETVTPNDPGRATPGNPGTGDVATPPPAPPTSPTKRAVDRRCPAELAYEAPGNSRAPLLSFTPDTLVICTYAVAPPPDDGRSSVVTSDRKVIDRFVGDVAALTIPPRELACTSEMGTTIAVIASGEGHDTTLWIQLYGCGSVFDASAHRIGGRTLEWLVEVR